MTIPPDGRHPFYPPTPPEGPKHLHDETAEQKAVSPPRHAEPTGAIPRIDQQRQQYPPRPAWVPPDEAEWQAAHQPAPPKKQRHIFRWVFLAIQLLFLIWIIAGISSASGSTAKSCAGLTGDALNTCTTASHAGTGIGVALIIVLWVIVDIILGISYLIFRKR